MGTVIKELVQRGHDMAADLNASCGAVDVRSVAKLISDLASQLDVQLVRGNQVQQQLAAVVTENAVLKAAVKKVIKLNRDHAKERHGDPNIAESWNYVKVLRKAKSETPATDAAIANIQAQGVEMFAERKNKEMMSLHPDTHAIGSIAAAMSAEVKELREFAAQLRQGEKS